MAVRADFTSLEPTLEAENAWVKSVHDIGHTTLYPLTNSWYTGTNIEGKVRMFTPYAGGVGTYRRVCEAVVAHGYDGFEFPRADGCIASELKPAAQRR